MTERSYGIIPFHKGETLEVFLIHQYGSRGDTLWTFPKGRGEPEETPIETAERELREETGLELRTHDALHPLTVSYVFLRHGSRVEKTTTFYTGFVREKDYILAPSEVKEGGWFSVVEARERITFPDQKQLLDDAVKTLDNK